MARYRRQHSNKRYALPSSPKHGLTHEHNRPAHSEQGRAKRSGRRNNKTEHLSRSRKSSAHLSAAPKSSVIGSALNKSARRLSSFDLNTLSHTSLDLSALNPKLPKVPLPFVGGVLVVFLALIIFPSIFGHGSSTLNKADAVYGSGGIKNTVLYEKKAKTFYADLLIPHVFAPARPTKTTVSGTRRDTGTAGDQLSAAINAIEAEGYAVGLALYDINTGITVSYNADLAFYSASSLKGPYVIGLTKYQLGDNVTSESGRIENIVEWSDNDAYSSLRDAYGNDSFAQLADAAGATAMSATPAADNFAGYDFYSTSLTDNKYEYISPNQLLALWKECYGFLSSDEPGANYLSEVFQTPEISAIRMSASALGTTWSKAGWYPDSDGYNTTVDAGAVCTNTGDFILCVMTNKGEDFVALESIVSPLVAVRATLIN